MERKEREVEARMKQKKRKTKNPPPTAELVEKEQKEREKNKSVLSFHCITSLFFSFLFLSFSPNSTDKEWMACLFCVDFNLITNEVEQVRELN